MNIKISEKVVQYRLKNHYDQEIKEPIGAYIKRERIVQGLNQEYVCKGICSPSYYSRIENNLINPSHDYIERIFTKLNKPLPIELQQPINQDLIDNFLTAIEYHNDTLVEETFNELTKYDFKKIYQLAYYIYHYNLEESEQLILLLHNQQQYFTNQELLLYLELIGSYYLLKDDFVKSKNYLVFAIQLSGQMGIEKPLILYKYAWTLGKINLDYKCIEFAQKAANIFEQNHNLYRSFQSQLLVAIKTSIRFPEKSISIYENLIKVSKQSNNKYFNKICKFNLALTLKKYEMYDKSEILFKNLIQDYYDDINFIQDIYLELTDLLLLIGKNDEGKDYFNLLLQSDHNEANHFYIKYFENKIYQNENNQLKLYKNYFIPHCVKNKNNEFELRCRKEYVLLLEKHNMNQICIQEYKKILKLTEKDKKIFKI